MLNTDSEGLNRVQSESRISSNTWRDWGARLGLDPADLVELWDEVCHPLMTASGVAPDIAFILQVRAMRRDLFIEEFKEEVPAVLLTANLLAALQDDRLSGARSTGSVLKLFQHLCASEPPGMYSPGFAARAVVDMCTTIVLAKALPGDNVSLHRLIRLITEGRSELDGLIDMAFKSIGDGDFAETIGQCMAERQAWIDAAAEPGVDDGPNPEQSEGGPDGIAAEDEADEATDVAQADDTDEGGEGGATEEQDHEKGDEKVADAPGAEAPGANASRIIDAFLAAFRQAMEAMYLDEEDEESDLDVMPDSHQDSAPRIRALAQYDPMRSRIPSMEEAMELSRQAAGGRSGKRSPERAQISGGGTGGAALKRALTGASGGGGKGGGSPKRATSASSGGKVGATKPTPGTRGAVRAGITGSMPSSSAAALSFAAVAAAGAGAHAGAHAGAKPAKAAGITPPAGVSAAGDDAETPDSDGEKLSVPRIRLDQITEVAGRIGDLLGSLEQLDTRVWQAFVDPTAEIADPRQFAEDLLTSNSTAQEAYKALRGVAQQQRIKTILSPPTDRRMNERRFDLEAEAFINTINNNRRELDPDCRQLISLPKVLDYATAGLVRLEALRSSLLLARDAIDEFDPKVASQRYEEALSEVTFLADRQIVEPARARADADAVTIGAALQAEVFADWVVEEVTGYVRQLQEEGNTESLESLSEAVKAAPLEFDGVEATGGPGESMPNRYADPAKLGEIFDWAREYVLGQVWDILQPIHQPEELMQRLDEELRKSLQGSIRLQPRRQRHEKNPKISLAVIGLDTLSGVPELGHLFVRLGNDGKLLYLTDFEDGTYVDLFELRKNTRRQMHVRAKGRAQDESSGELQAGADYLHTIGRTNAAFGTTQQEVMAGCILSEDDTPRIYPI